eukprot:scaffold181723_cov15-Prasinocladus_malaysianus.AAC.2
MESQRREHDTYPARRYVVANNDYTYDKRSDNRQHRRRAHQRRQNLDPNHRQLIGIVERVFLKVRKRLPKRLCGFLSGFVACVKSSRHYNVPAKFPISDRHHLTDQHQMIRPVPCG